MQLLSSVTELLSFGGFWLCHDHLRTYYEYYDEITSTQSEVLRGAPLTGQEHIRMFFQKASS
jgi:hypothetical protein